MDIWSHYTPYPFNQIPRSYSFMVAHPALWKFNYYLQQPRWVHVPTQRMWAPFVSRQACPLFSLQAIEARYRFCTIFTHYIFATMCCSHSSDCLCT